jgi:uncharacterized membrane protein YuzA (DUF378 family)
MMHVICHWLKCVAYVVAIIALINMGLIPFGYNLFETEFMLFTVPWLFVPFHYIAGLAGIFFAVKFFGCLTGRRCGSGDCGCTPHTK